MKVKKKNIFGDVEFTDQQMEEFKEAFVGINTRRNSDILLKILNTQRGLVIFPKAFSL